MTPSASPLLTEILDTAAALRTAQPDAVPVAFWDFDGTLIEGDCSEGLQGDDGVEFAGLVETAIGRGLSSRYAHEEGFTRCMEECRHVIAREGLAAGYTFLVQAFAGADVKDLLHLARQHFADVLQPWFFTEALDLWHGLESAGVRCFVLSASADFFVKGAANMLRVDENRIHGIRLVTRADGMLSAETVPPVTHGIGKAERMREILAELAGREPERSFWPIAAFGNHPGTDGPLLEAVVHTKLPVGTPLGVIVNTASPCGQFREIIFCGRTALPVF